MAGKRKTHRRFTIKGNRPRVLEDLKLYAGTGEHLITWSNLLPITRASNFDEGSSRIRTGHGPKNIGRLRRFAAGLIKSNGRAACC